MYLAIDEGTTNLKLVVFDDYFRPVQVLKERIPTRYPREGWVEQDMDNIWLKLRGMLKDIRRDVKSIGIANQRETTVLWDADTGKLIHPAIVWQCRRTADIIESLKGEYGEFIKERTGLEMDPYFSASKIKWILDSVPGAREKAEAGRIKFGTVDSYLIWKLTGGQVHATDHTNASRTMLYNIHTGEWDSEIMEIFEIPPLILPEIRDSAAHYGYAKIDGKEVPITGVIGDQQSALLAHGCIHEGDMKITYGTGTFMLLNMGEGIRMERGLLTTVAWAIKGKRDYAMEGSILSSGTVVEWLKSMGLWSEEVGEEGSLYFVPAFSGLGSPYWDPSARGTIIGLTAHTERRDITRAALESIAYMVRDIMELMKSHTGMRGIMADGGMTQNEFLMQFQADITGIGVRVSEYEDMTARGAALLSAVGNGDMDFNSVKSPENYRDYIPRANEAWRENRYRRWKEAVKRSMRWI